MGPRRQIQVILAVANMPTGAVLGGLPVLVLNAAIGGSFSHPSRAVAGLALVSWATACWFVAGYHRAAMVKDDRRRTAAEVDLRDGTVPA
jgi:hypothetical protein